MRASHSLLVRTKFRGLHFAEKVLEPMELDVKFEYAIAYPGKNMGRFSTSAKDQCWSPARQCEF